jgi:hypothetical protein
MRDLQTQLSLLVRHKARSIFYPPREAGEDFIPGRIGRGDLRLPGILAGSLGNAIGTHAGFVIAELLK